MNPAPASSSTAQPKKKSNLKWFLIGGVALVVILAIVAVKAKGKQDTGLPVTTEKAIVKTITQVVTATGKVQPEVEVKISPEVAGEIIEMPPKEGSRVKKGDLLVKIRPDTYQAQVEQQEANLVAAKASAVQAKAQLLKAQDDAKRSTDLFSKKLISDSDDQTAQTNLEVAQANYDNALAQIRRTEGSLNQVRDQLSKTIIFAPMDGTISALESEIGERVVGTGSFAGTEIMRVADLSNMELRVKVNENDIPNVKIGDKAVISIDAYPGRKFSGKVHEIGSSADGSTTGTTAQSSSTVSDSVTNFLVKIRISDRDIQLRPGMSATADIETQTVENVIAVPIQSVTVRAEGGLTADEMQQKKAKAAQEKSGNDLEVKNERDEARRDRDKLARVVFIKVGDKVKMQAVETGIADNTHIEVKKGVKAGDEIVSGSYAAISRKLKDGMKVQLEKPKPADKK
ncbi:MAG: efflux RND transporter periplasmic adaptor subunit [Verrucomicrobia bacterium]|nr:efflux RND transporter periplasmic adaptor subunit [Verrucomicrobiota bacterium]